MKANYFLIFILIVVGFYLIQIFEPFLGAVSVAVLLTIATNSIYIAIHQKFNSSLYSSLIITLILFLLFFAPLTYFIIYFGKYLLLVDQHKIILILSNIKGMAIEQLEQHAILKEYLSNFITDLDMAQLLKTVLTTGAKIGKNSLGFLSEMFMILVFYFIFNLYSISLVKYIKQFMPLKQKDKDKLFVETSNVMGVVFYSILITAIFEGFLFGVFISFYEYNGLLLGVLYGFASLIPVIGGILMWLPIGLYQFFSGNQMDALVIVLYSIFVISIFADTFIKPMIIHYINDKILNTPTSVNELLIFFSIVAGISTLGFWGMIIAPAMVAFCISILELLKSYQLKEGIE